MRAGAYSLQHTLTGEAEAVVKQAVALAKRRGHAQVTPLHVANAMLAASSGLLRAACLQSHSHPLQCKALELCFNVALNRLPASSSSPMLSHHSQQQPSISNALVAAFKRAQAHRRRGSIENQQQPLLAVKIEIEQLIISILDDPSVSRVMREAGFSSTQVKSNLEKVVSLELCSQSSSPPPPRPPPLPSNNSKENIQIKIRTEQIKNDDVGIIIESLLMNRKRKNLVIVGECISDIESRVKELMDRVDKGEVPEGLREVKFVSIPPFHSFCNLDRDLVERKMLELSCLVRSLVAKGVVLYLGDLNWISEYRINLEQQRSYYCSVEHMIMELGRLVSGINGDIGRFWLVGIATFQTYMRCRSGYHSLETVWGLHPVTIPANTLGLSLVSQSDQTQLPTTGDIKLTCCEDCSSKFEAEARTLETGSINETTLSSLPPWLKDECTRRINDQNCDSIGELCTKWNSYCTSAHKQHTISMERTVTFSSASPSSSTSCFSFDQQNPSLHQSQNLAFVSNQSSTSNSPSSSDVMDTTAGYVQKFKEFNAQNLNILCDALEKQVPWQKEIIPEIAGTILQGRCGMLRRKDNCNTSTDNLKEETWLFFLGVDAQAKEKISKELAKVVFGSYSNLVQIGIRYMDEFVRAVSENPHRVFLVQDLEQADYCFQKGIKRAIERGRISNQNGEEVSFCDAIIVLSCERLASFSSSSSSPLDLNICFEEDGVKNESIDELGILENVDRCVVFQVQDVLVE